MKLAHILLSIAFAVGCLGLWLGIWVVQMLHRAYPFPEVAAGGRLGQSALAALCFAHSSWLPYFGVPAVAYALLVSFRGKPSAEGFCVFASVLALVFAVVCSVVLLGTLTSWVPVYD